MVPRMFQNCPPGPQGAQGGIFGQFLCHFGPPGGNLFGALGLYFPPLGPYFPYPLLALSGNYPQWEDVRDGLPDRFTRPVQIASTTSN